MTAEKTIKRTFQLRGGGEKNGLIWVEIMAKDGSGPLGAWLPKDKIKVSNRQYGWGGAMSADIELPVSLVPLFKILK